MQENPFGKSPNPKFFHTTATHRSALQKIYWAIRENKAFVLVTGSAGSGKTFFPVKYLKIENCKIISL
jgi:type II secretory pathway predicted ATPase ExeA